MPLLTTESSSHPYLVSRWSFFNCWSSYLKCILQLLSKADHLLLWSAPLVFLSVFWADEFCLKPPPKYWLHVWLHWQHTSRTRILGFLLEPRGGTGPRENLPHDPSSDGTELLRWNRQSWVNWRELKERERKKDKKLNTTSDKLYYITQERN